MSNVALARPTTITSAIITCTKFGTGGTDFYMKVKDSMIGGSMDIEKTNGDGDAVTSWDMNYWLDFRFTLKGWLVAYSVSSSVANFIANFIDPTKNPLAASFKLNLATSLVITAPAVAMPRFRFGYSRDGITLPMTIECYATNTASVNTNVTLAAT